MTDIQRTHVEARYSDSSSFNGIVFLAGQVSSVTGGIEAQTRDVLATIDRLLAEVGSSKARILMAQIFLSDLADFGGMNEVWDAWVVPGHTPCRATVQAQLARTDWKIEVVVTAARGQ